MLSAATGMLLVLVPLALEVAGCNNAFQPARWAELRSEPEPKELRIVPRSNKDVANLSPDDIVNVMQRVGFSDEEILVLGTDLHNALRSSGAAGVIYGRETEVVYAVNGELLFVNSRSQGTFIYDLARSRFGLMPPPPGAKR